MPSTFVPLRMTSAFISIARRAAAVSVVKYGLPGTGGEDHDAALFQVAHRAAADERLRYGAHLDRRRDACGHVDVLQRVLERERVDHGRQHAHVVRGGAIHAFRAGRETAEEIAAADDDGRLDAELLDFSDLFRNLGRDGGIDPERLFPHERLARQLEEDAAVNGIGHVSRIIPVAARDSLLAVRNRKRVANGEPRTAKRD